MAGSEISAVNQAWSTGSRLAPPISEPVISRDLAQESDDLIT